MTYDNDEPDLSVTIRVVRVSGEPVAAEALLDQMEEVIQGTGFCLIGDTFDDRPMTYTVGLNKRHCPDILTLYNCLCSDKVVDTLARRQLKAGPFEDGQITAVNGTIVRLTTWRYAAQFDLFNTYYARYYDRPTLLLAEAVHDA